MEHVRCPVCGQPLALEERVLRCPAGHAVDVARQGYAHLAVGGRAHPGDTAAMVAARDAFLGAGHYVPIAQAVADALGEGELPPGPVVDVGGGTGWYLAQVLDRLPPALGVRDGLCLDSSSAALRRAARVHPRVAALGVDVWRGLPLADGCASAVLSVFAPRNPAEVARVLGPAGRWVVVTPRPEHLRELVGPLGMLTVDARKDDRLAADLADFERTASTDLAVTVELDHPALRALVGMGPSAHHVPAAELEARLADLPPTVAVTVAVRVSTYALS
ncbi:23S rRNA methyltransferase [Kineococcus sp. R8]|nr:23S rRNA methyltransferase [Kineococcus siccus]